jgi:hypothetical protein
VYTSQGFPMAYESQAAPNRLYPVADKFQSTQPPKNPEAVGPNMNIYGTNVSEVCFPHAIERNLANNHFHQTGPSNPSNPPTTTNGNKICNDETITPSPLNAATLAAHNANSYTTLRADEQAARIRVDAVQEAARKMDFELPHEDPWTGKRTGEGWLDSQARMHSGVMGSQPRKGKD